MILGKSIDIKNIAPAIAAIVSIFNNNFECLFILLNLDNGTSLSLA